MFNYKKNNNINYIYNLYYHLHFKIVLVISGERSCSIFVLKIISIELDFSCMFELKLLICDI